MASANELLAQLKRLIWCFDNPIHLGSNTGAVAVWAGDGSPEGVYLAPKGSLYLQRDSALGTVWKKTTIGTLSTGWAEVDAGGGAAWGAITGTLSNQTDLQTALDLKTTVAALTAHEAAGDPHVQYLTAAEANAAYQPLDSDLTTLAASITAAGHTLVAAANAAAQRTALGLVVGTDVQAQDAELAAIASLTSAADRLPYFTGSGTAALAVFTGQARDLLDDADAAAMQSTIGVVIGTNVQAFDATLGALAALNSTAGLVEQTGADAFTKRAIGVVAGTDIISRDDGDGRYATVGHSHSGLAPAGGTTGQVLKKIDNTDFNYSWQADAGGSGSPGGQTTEVQFNLAGAFEGADRLTFASATAGAAFGGGTASAGTWPTFASGTLLTTPEAGAIERDANCFYLTTDAGNRGYVPVRHFIRCNATRTLPNDTNVNAIFNSPTNGRITLETGTYIFEALVGITSMSATSGNALINILGAGTAVVGDWRYSCIGKDGTLVSVAAVLGTMPVTSSTPASAFTAGTAAEMWFVLQGTFTVTTAGTLIPSIDQVTAAAAVVGIGSYFMCERIGDTSVVSVGQWD